MLAQTEKSFEATNNGYGIVVPLSIVRWGIAILVASILMTCLSMWQISKLQTEAKEMYCIANRRPIEVIVQRDV